MMHERLKALFQDEEFARVAAQEKLLLEITEGLAAFMKAKDVTQSDLAARLGKSRSRISQLFGQPNNMTLRTLADLLWAMDGEMQVAMMPSQREEKKGQFKHFFHLTASASCLPEGGENPSFRSFEAGDFLVSDFYEDAA